MKMIKADATTLKSFALDWAVGQALGKDPIVNWHDIGGIQVPFVFVTSMESYRIGAHYSTSDAQAGPLIDQRKISTLWHPMSETWSAYCSGSTALSEQPTRLIAAMRILVISELGYQPDIPKELFP